MSESTTPTTPAATTETTAPAGATTPEAPKTPTPAEGTTAATLATPPAGAGDVAKPTEPEKVEPPKPPEEDKVAKGFAEIARREKALRKEVDAHKASLAEAKRVTDFVARVKADPGALLEEAAAFFGVSLDDAIEASAKKLKTETVEEKVARLERERAEEKAAAEKAAKDAQAKSVADEEARVREKFTTNIRAHVEAKPDDFKATRFVASKSPSFDPGAVILQVIEAHWNETAKEAENGDREEPELWSIEEAARRVEEHLMKEMRARKADLDGFAALFGAAPGTPAAAEPPAATPPPKTRPAQRFEDEDEDEPAKARRPVTITNRDAAGAPRVVVEHKGTLSDEEAFEATKRKFEEAVKAKKGRAA